MAFLRNNTVNLLNLHYGIRALVMSGGGAFLAVFLLKSGVSAPLVLVSLAAIVILRFFIRPLVLVFAKWFGLKPAVVFGTIMIALQFPFLAVVDGFDGALLAFIAVAAVGDAFYWTSYHAYFALLGDAEHRGHQIGAREAAALLVGIVAPLLGGWTLANLGPWTAFNIVAVVQILSALPLLGTPKIAVAESAPGAFKAAMAGVFLFAADGWIAASYLFVWQIALFLTLGEDFTAFGGAMALSAIVGAVTGMLLGRHIDAGHGGNAAWMAFVALALTIVLRTVSAEPVMAVAANALGALVGCLYAPAMMTAVYNLAKNSPCALRFHLVTEGAWDAGCAAGCLTAAALIALGTPIAYAIPLSLAGAVTWLMLLRRYYAGLAE